ncbi:unnamed protein product [Nezara viridula]|uniref:Uncharacterized protein n=1 Tax=Nezara viridula TaxID=85310 RepID=A0A9P0HKI8_NEZVI|nr:unnamed protein product [Nezara viridula]
MVRHLAFSNLSVKVGRPESRYFAEMPKGLTVKTEIRRVRRALSPRYCQKRCDDPILRRTFRARFENCDKSAMAATFEQLVRAARSAVTVVFKGR